MLLVKRQSQVDKLKGAVRDAVAYLDEIAGDERLRADVRAAIGHGSEVGDQIRDDIAAGSIATRIANDRKLRKKLRAVLDDIDSASDRMRRKERHRLRNGLLMLGGVAATAVAVPKTRRWLADRMAGDSQGSVDAGMAV